MSFGFLSFLRRQESRWVFWLFGVASVEVVSLVTVFQPSWNAAATVIFGLAMAIIAFRKPSFGLALLLAEMLLGSKGALLKIPHGMDVDGGNSLRIILFSAFMLGWFVNAVLAWRLALPELKRSIIEMMRSRRVWLLLAGLCAVAFLNGVLRHQSHVFQDINAWFFLILLIPTLDVARRDPRGLFRDAQNAAFAALVWLPIKTLGLLYVFSHGIQPASHVLYLWVRRTGVGEITLVTGNLFRIFIQSQIYAIPGLFLVLARWATAPHSTESGNSAGRLHLDSCLCRNDRGLWWVLAVGSWVSILISLSRSFWIGLAVAGVFFVFLVWRMKGWARVWSAVWRGGLSVVIALVLMASVVFFPFPHVDTGSLATLFGSRGTAGDAAAESRWSLLPTLFAKIKQAPILGSGFGATVTYKTKDPRILAQHPDGMYTTYAFEWGWLEHWIKFGILGIPVMGYLIWSIGSRLWKSDEEEWLRLSAVVSLVALSVIHVFTPYLNHPLGFTFLLVCEALIILSTIPWEHRAEQNAA